MKLLKLNGVRIDANLKDLNTSSAIFTIEFEYDSKIMICSTTKKNTILQELKIVIQKLSNPTDFTYNIETKYAFLRSQYLTISIAYKPIQLGYYLTKKVMAKFKYDVINNYKSYAPYGHNHLESDKIPLYEAEYADSLLEQVADDIRLDFQKDFEERNARQPERDNKLKEQGYELIDIEEAIDVIREGCKAVSRETKVLYQYAQVVEIHNSHQKAVWRLKKVWPSVKTAVESTSKWSQSNISAACSSITKTAYGYKWSYLSDIEDKLNQYQEALDQIKHGQLSARLNAYNELGGQAIPLSSNSIDSNLTDSNPTDL